MSHWWRSKLLFCTWFGTSIFVLFSSAVDCPVASLDLSPRLQCRLATQPLYCSSLTFSIRSTTFSSSASLIAMCVIAVLGLAPCQCLSGGTNPEIPLIPLILSKPLLRSLSSLWSIPNQLFAVSEQNQSLFPSLSRKAPIGLVP